MISSKIYIWVFYILENLFFFSFVLFTFDEDIWYNVTTRMIFLKLVIISSSLNAIEEFWCNPLVLELKI